MPARAMEIMVHSVMRLAGNKKIIYQKGEKEHEKVMGKKEG